MYRRQWQWKNSVNKVTLEVGEPPHPVDGLLWPNSWHVTARAGASTRFTSTSTSTSTCNMCEFNYEYLIITWVRVRVRLLVDEYEYEYRPSIYILYKQQYCIFQSLKRESSDFYKPGTKLQLPIVHVNFFCQSGVYTKFSGRFVRRAISLADTEISLYIDI